MGHVKNIALLAALGAGLGASGPALAADMPEQPYVEPAVPIATGAWYLRGDIGYKIYTTPDASFVTGTYTDTWSNNSLDNTGLIGFGAGYRFNDYFRADVTVDYEFPSSFSGEGPCGSCKSGTDHSTETADLYAWTFLANAYVDLGTYSGLTPYVGAGLGTSYIGAKSINYVNPDGSAGSWDEGNKWNFAWALTAGASYAFTPNTSVDLNYRYLNLGDAVSGYVPAGGGGQIHYDNISASEIRLGLRYSFY